MSRAKSKVLLPLQNPHAAGIDVGSSAHYVCVGADADNDVRSFGTLTIDLQGLADWLQECGVTTIAVESTGIYWIPLFELLERRGFHVILVDPRQTRRSGRPKTDVLDCQWIWRLHCAGLLSVTCGVASPWPAMPAAIFSRCKRLSTR